MGCTSAKPRAQIPTPVEVPSVNNKDIAAAVGRKPSVEGAANRGSEGKAAQPTSWVKDNLGFKAHLAKVNAFSHLEAKYELGTLLGEGITGQVRLCTSKVDGQVYAMKSLNVSKMDDMQLAELRAEIEMLKHLDHPNVVSLVEIFEGQNNICLIMEYCGGGDVSDRRFRSELELANVMNQILRAVTHCHKTGVIHRDLKLENVLFVSKNSDMLRLIDFGLSKMFFQGQGAAESSGQTELERLNDKSRALETVCGTVCYMAPEVLTRNYTEKADVWAVGIVAYTLMTGAPPFIGETETDVLRLVKKGDVAYDEHVWKRLGPEAKSFVQSLLTYDVEKRPSAAEAVKLPWLANFRARRLEAKPISRDLAKRACEALLKFAAYPLLKKAAFMIIAHHATDKEKTQLQDLFLYLDDEFDGELEARHLNKLFREFAPELGLTDDQIVQTFNVVDQDRTGFVHHMEFLSATIEAIITPSPRLIDQAFDHLDADASGLISAENIFDLLGERYSRKDADDILAQGFLDLDMEPQPAVTRSQFFQMMEKVGLPSPFSTRISPEKAKPTNISDAPPESPLEPPSVDEDGRSLLFPPLPLTRIKSEPLQSIQE